MLIIFYIFAALSILGGLGVLFLRNPIHCALSLVGTFFCLGSIYVMLNAEFVAVIQVLVYAGAIMVECIGACSFAPAVIVNEDYHEQVTPESMDKMIDKLLN